MCVCLQGAQHRGSAAYQARANPIRPAALHSPAPEWLQGYTKAIHKTRDLNRPWYMFTAQPTMGGNTAGTTTKCQSKPLNNKMHREKLISVTHVTICKPPKAPSCAPTLSRSASCLYYCHSPSSCTRYCLAPCQTLCASRASTSYSSSSSTIMGGGDRPHPHWAHTCEAKKHGRPGATPRASW